MRDPATKAEFLELLREEQHERCYWRRVGFVVFLAALLAVILAPVVAQAEPIMKLEQGGVKIVLHSDDCKLTEVANLPKRATWEENGKTFEGCWGLQPQMRVVMMYVLEDKSVGVAPASAFVRVIGA